jgi:hypothetical protein
VQAMKQQGLRAGLYSFNATRLRNNMFRREMPKHIVLALNIKHTLHDNHYLCVKKLRNGIVG